jgi:hypothetical protein
MRFLLRAPVLIAIFSVLMAAVIAGTVYLVVRPQSSASNPSGPLRLTGPVSVSRNPTGTLGCNASVAFVGSAPISGSGTLTYQWERSDGVQPVLRQVPVASGQSSFQTEPIYWSFTGAQQTTVTMTLHILKPSDTKIATSLTDSCR